MEFDAIVLGLGGMGSATVDQLTQRGLKVLGFDRQDPPHTLGSTHGKSRIIRLAYMEHPAYVPLLHRTYELWRELEHASGTDLLQITGGLMIGAEDSLAVAGSHATALEHGIPHELMDAAGVAARFPAFQMPADYVALLDGSAGVLNPEACIEASLARARSAGADLRSNTVVENWRSKDAGVAVEADGEVFLGKQLIITAGAWTGQLLPDLHPHLTVTREVMHWFEPLGAIEDFAASNFPIYFWEPPVGDIFYGFPALDGPDGGVKVAIHHGGGPTSPDTVSREIEDSDIERVRACLESTIPALNGRWIEGAVCLYTNTPDAHFVLGTHPQHANVHLAAGLSGHGFKFASVVGEILADLATKGAPSLPIDLFSPGRFA